LPAVLASISVHQSACSALEVEKREATQSGQAEVGSQGFMVRQLYHLSSLNFGLIKNARTWIDQFHRDNYHTYIRGEVLFARPRAKPARRWPYRRLAITPSRYPGPRLLLPRAIRMHVLRVTKG
jgi:hypothetical protein